MNELKFFHIPKTGGTSIEESAKKLGILWGRYERQNQYLIQGINKWHTPQRIQGDVFCVIRNPLDRILSSFRHVYQISHYNVHNLNLWIPKIISEAKENPYIRDAHFLPQSEFAKHCDIFLLFDDLQNELNWVTKNYGLPQIELNHHFGGWEQDKKREGKEYYYFSVDDISDENKMILLEFYHDDMELYKKIYVEWVARKFDSVGK